METVCVKFEENMLRDVEKAMKKNRYATKTEFIREAVRDKLGDYEKKMDIESLKKMYGMSKKRTTQEQLRKARDKAFEELDKELGE
ncbi:hypothetical protein HZA97_04680 [Candidatus Woesearchaeota archaeon]|nr:hypothetical protein [Candidatus Woesearchaeota archaeon]